MSVEQDARLKRLQLTEEGLSVNEAVWRDIKKIESCIVQGFSEREVRSLLDYLERIRTNLENN